MCAINVNEFDGNVGTNTQHDTNTNPDAILLGSIEKNSEEAKAKAEAQALSRPHPHPIKRGDVNGDGNIDGSDVDSLKDALRNGDMNGDGKLDRDDYLKLKEIALNSSMYPTDPVEGEEQIVVRSKGDMNGDGKIDKRDLAIFGRVLRSADIDSDRKIDQTDLELLIKETGWEEVHQDIRKGEGTPVSEIDLNGDGKYDFEEWKSEMIAKGIEAYTEKEKEMKEICDNFGGISMEGVDCDGNGKLDKNDFIGLIKRLQESGASKEEILQIFDTNNDGKFSFVDHMTSVKENGFIVRDEGKFKAYFERALGDGVDLNSLFQEVHHEEREGIPVSEIDLDSNGKYDFNEWKSDMNNSGIRISPKMEKRYEELFKQMGDISVSEMDLDKNGKLDSNDFVLQIQRLKEKGMDNKQISDIFDNNHDGKYDFSDNKANLEKAGFIITDEEKHTAGFKRIFGDGVDLKALLGTQNGSEIVNPPSSAQIAPSIKETDPDE